MIERDGRGTHSQAPRLNITLDITPDDIQDFFKTVQLIYAHVHHEIAEIGNYVVRLIFCLNDGHTHLDWTKQVGNFWKLERAEPFNVTNGMVDVIVALFARCVTSLAVRNSVQYQQSFFGDSHLHLRWFSNNSEINFSQY